MKAKPWIKNLQNWSWIITIVWITIANFWHPFGLYGLVCMFTPIILALTGHGKMHCARVCPRGSFLGFFLQKVSLGLKKPAFMKLRSFRWLLWGLMMGSFFVLFVTTIIRTKSVYSVGNFVLIFMEVATGLSIIFGILFTPRAWCTVCPMGFTQGNLRGLLKKREQKKLETQTN